MATPATIWATNAGAGAADGTSLADAYSLANAIAAINGLGALSQDLTLKICGDCVTAAALAVTKDATTTYRVIVQGRSAGDTADAEVDIDADDGAYDVWTLTTADYWSLRHVHAKNTDEAAGHDGFALGADADNVTFESCRASHCNDGWDVNAAAWTQFYGCRAHHNAAYGLFGGSYTSAIVRCLAHNNTDGIYKGQQVECVGYNNTVMGLRPWGTATRCIAHGNGSHGFRNGAAENLFVDCLSVGNGGYGFYNGTAEAIALFRSGDYNNTSGRKTGNNVYADLDDPGLTADPFVDAANGDFTLNNAAGGGALIKRLALAFPGGLTTTYGAIGPYQPRPGIPNKRGGKQ